MSLIAEIDDRLFGHLCANCTQNGESAYARVKDADVSTPFLTHSYFFDVNNTLTLLVISSKKRGIKIFLFTRLKQFSNASSALPYVFKVKAVDFEGRTLFG